MFPVHWYIVLFSTEGEGNTQSTGSFALRLNMALCGVTPVLLLTVVLYANTDALIHRSQLFCTPAPLVLSIAIIVLWKRSTGLEDGLYGGVVVCCKLNSENKTQDVEMFVHVWPGCVLPYSGSDMCGSIC